MHNIAQRAQAWRGAGTRPQCAERKEETYQGLARLLATLAARDQVCAAFDQVCACLCCGAAGVGGFLVSAVCAVPGHWHWHQSSGLMVPHLPRAKVLGESGTIQSESRRCPTE